MHLSWLMEDRGSVIAFRDINDTISGLQSLLQPTPDKLEEVSDAAEGLTTTADLL